MMRCCRGRAVSTTGSADLRAEQAFRGRVTYLGVPIGEFWYASVLTCQDCRRVYFLVDNDTYEFQSMPDPDELITAIAMQQVKST